MKIVRLMNNTVVEIIPASIPCSQLSLFYNDEFASQCIEAPDEVQQHWHYISGAWIEPEPTLEPPHEPDPLLENYLVDLDFRLSLIELGVI